METTLYDDNMKSVKKMKFNMTLDLANNPLKHEKLNEMLASPDLGLLMLTSPDLERFIIQQSQNGMVLTTPTPTTQILFPRSVTEEQEAYARGFVDALGELHKTHGQVSSRSANGLTTMVKPSAAVYTTMSNVMTSTTTTQLPGSVLSIQPRVLQIPSSTTSRVVGQIIPQPAGRYVIEKAQTVPNIKQQPSMIPTSIAPIDMDDQEMQKLERKRARNRVAATRCRNRKLERISRLEDRVKELKNQNSTLAQTASALREQVCQLKQNIIEHTNRGCQVMLAHNIL